MWLIKKLDVWNNFPNFSCNEKFVKLVLSKIHEKFLWIDRPHLITKEVIRDVTGLWDKGTVPTLKYVKNEVVKKLIGVAFDKRALATKTITNPTVKYASFMIGHKIYFTNRENYVSATTIYTGYDMVVKGTDYDLCELFLL